MKTFGLNGPIDPEVTVMLPEPLASEVRALMASGSKIDAVRLVRRKTGINLIPAVRAVEAIGPSGNS